MPLGKSREVVGYVISAYNARWVFYDNPFAIGLQKLAKEFNRLCLTSVRAFAFKPRGPAYREVCAWRMRDKQIPASRLCVCVCICGLKRAVAVD